MKRGFTLLETSIVLIFVALIAILGTIQILNLAAMNRDNDKKTALNAMYYALENDFYAKNGYYPESISAEILPVVPATSWDIPYIYEPANCTQGRCKEFILKVPLEKETEYIKQNG